MSDLTPQNEFTMMIGIRRIIPNPAYSISMYFILFLFQRLIWTSQISYWKISAPLCQVKNHRFFQTELNWSSTNGGFKRLGKRLVFMADTVDGRHRNHQLKTVVNIPWFIGFQPSQIGGGFRWPIHVVSWENLWMFDGIWWWEMIWMKYSMTSHGVSGMLVNVRGMSQLPQVWS